MNASSNAFWPVAAITVGRSGGLLSSGMTYGADPYQLLVSVAACAGLPANAAIDVPRRATALALANAMIRLRRIRFPLY